MATLLKDDAGIPIPQYSNNLDSSFEPMRGENGAIYAYVAQLNDVIAAITNLSKATGNTTILQQMLTALQQTTSVLNTIRTSLATTDANVAAILECIEEMPGMEPITSAELEAMWDT